MGKVDKGLKEIKEHLKELKNYIPVLPDPFEKYRYMQPQCPKCYSKDTLLITARPTKIPTWVCPNEHLFTLNEIEDD
jgi:hypothetical protein